MDWIPPIYILCNPAYESDRFTFLCKHFASRGIPEEKIHYIHGPWGSEMPNSLYWNVYDPFLKRFGIKQQLSSKASALLKAEVSLNLSFAKCCETIANQKEELALIFESDIRLRKDFLTRLKEVLQEAENQPWDYISLGEGVGTRAPGIFPFLGYFGPTKLFEHKGFGGFRCCDSMLFKRSFLERVRGTLIPFRECLDWELNIQKEIHRGTVFWADPPLAEPGSAVGRNKSHLPA